MESTLVAVIGVLTGAIAAGVFVHLRAARAAAATLEERTLERDALRVRAEERALEVERLRANLDGAAERAAADRAAMEQRIAEQKKYVEQAEKRLEGVFAGRSQEALDANSKRFLTLATETFGKALADMKGDADTRATKIDAALKPVRELLDKQQSALAALETKREKAYAGLEAHIQQIAESHQRLDRQTGNLVSALRRPEQRGRWGEMQLRNAVEMAGMSHHCDFREQAQTDADGTRDRPDMVVNLPGGGVIVVDSKVALDAYLDAQQPDADRDACLERHARQIENHRRGLAARRYWEQFERTPQLVVMFMPVESALVAALDKKPDLHADAMRDNVLIATPTLLVALLRAIAYGWQQEATAANAREVAQTGRELYDRLGTFAEHLARVGKGIAAAGDAYNKSIGSLERSVLPSARRFRDLEVVTAVDEEITPPPLVETEPRTIEAAELLPPGGTKTESD